MFFIDISILKGRIKILTENEKLQDFKVFEYLNILKSTLSEKNLPKLHIKRLYILE